MTNRRRNLNPFVEEMTEDYVDEDNIKVLLTDYSNWLSTTAIPKYFDECLNSNSTININTRTLNNYLIKVNLILEDKFPKKFAWEESECTTRMSGDDFEKKCKHERGRGNVDLSEDTKHRIYSKSSPWINEIYYHWMPKIYLEQVDLNLMKTAESGSTYHALQKRVMIDFTKEACGWGGEVKLQKCSEWNYNN